MMLTEVATSGSHAGRSHTTSTSCSGSNAKRPLGDVDVDDDEDDTFHDDDDDDCEGDDNDEDDGTFQDAQDDCDNDETVQLHQPTSTSSFATAFASRQKGSRKRQCRRPEAEPMSPSSAPKKATSTSTGGVAAAAAAGRCPSPSSPSSSSANVIMTPLPLDFEPSDNDVLVGRGKRCFNHIGNHRFRLLVNSYLDQYAATKSKLGKSAILRQVVQEVRARCHRGNNTAAVITGGFVKRDHSTGQWHEVGNFLAREKTSQCFRDALHERYRSSTKSKKKRRQVELKKATDNLHRLAHSESTISTQLQELSTAVVQGGTEDHMNDLFNRTNMEILRRLNQLSSQQHEQQQQQQQYLDEPKPPKEKVVATPTTPASTTANNNNKAESSTSKRAAKREKAETSSHSSTSSKKSNATSAPMEAISHSQSSHDGQLASWMLSPPLPTLLSLTQLHSSNTSNNNNNCTPDGNSVTGMDMLAVASATTATGSPAMMVPAPMAAAAAAAAAAYGSHSAEFASTMAPPPGLFHFTLPFSFPWATVGTTTTSATSTTASPALANYFLLDPNESSTSHHLPSTF